MKNRDDLSLAHPNSSPHFWAGHMCVPVFEIEFTFRQKSPCRPDLIQKWRLQTPRGFHLRGTKADTKLSSRRNTVVASFQKKRHVLSYRNRAEL